MKVIFLFDQNQMFAHSGLHSQAHLCLTASVVFTISPVALEHPRKQLLTKKMILIPFLASLLFSCHSQANPPSLSGDTRVNKLLTLNAKRGGLRRLDPSSELVRELPPGSGRWEAWCILYTYNFPFTKA